MLFTGAQNKNYLIFKKETRSSFRPLVKSDQNQINTQIKAGKTQVTSAL